MSVLDISGRRIGAGAPCFIVAEAGVNHNGRLDMAMHLIDAARYVGADAVKFQTWITEDLVVPEAPTAAYQHDAGQPATQYEMLKALELGQEQFAELKIYAERCGVLFLSSPDEEGSADFLERLGVAAFKIGSGELTNLPYLGHVARKGRPILLSTGMATLDEVAAAVAAIEETGNRQLALLHCVSSYPADPADANLRAMDTLAATFGYPVGFSDHTLGHDVAVAAVARGACVLEKHLTLDRSLPGPDHRSSLDPAEFAAMVAAVRVTERALGDGVKRPVQAEFDIRSIARKVIVTARPLKAGATVAQTDLVFRRASGGLTPASVDQIVGRRLNHDLPANVPVTLDVLE